MTTLDPRLARASLVPRELRPPARPGAVSRVRPRVLGYGGETCTLIM